jgi:succinyl-diaminopimelate desuccinylase
VIGTTTDLEARLAERTLELVAIPSVSEQEDEVLAAIAAAMPGEADDAHDGCLLYLPPAASSGSRVLFAGHVDTVPAAGAPAPARQGEAIVGRGAADMKGGCAVMVEAGRDLASGEIASDLAIGFLFFGREEIASDRSPLPALFERRPELRDIDLVVMMEPTDGALELGCLGNLDAAVRVRGVAAHSARPWLGDNAIHRAAEVIRAIAANAERPVEIEGLTYREVTSVTQIGGGIAPNVVPDGVELTVNHRYAPDRSPQDAEEDLRRLVERDGVELDVRSNSGAGPVPRDHPLVRRLRERSSLEVRPKQAWTPVAEFAALGVDAVNLGPGDPAFAHRDDERIEIAALLRSSAILRAFLAGER